MCITKPCTHLHPAPSTSIQHNLACTKLSCYWNQNIPRNWTISPNLGGKIQFNLTENWHTRYLGGADSEPRLRFLKFVLQNPFLGKFGPKKLKLSVLSENWHTWYLEDADSFSNISFLNFKT